MTETLTNFSTLGMVIIRLLGLRADFQMFENRLLCIFHWILPIFNKILISK